MKAITKQEKHKQCSKLYRHLIKRKLPATPYLTERLGVNVFKFYFIDGSKETIEYSLDSRDLVRCPWDVEEIEISEGFFIITNIKEKNG